MEELKRRAEALKADVDEAVKAIKLDELEKKHAELARQTAAPDFWHNNPSAQSIAQEEGTLAVRIEPWRKLADDTDELSGLTAVADESMLEDLRSQADELERRLAGLRKELQFAGPYDERDVILNIYAGAGGTDAQDWAQILMRMYTHWAEDHKLKVHTIDQTPGEEAGIKSASLEITGGSFLYGKLAGEHGVHRLVRLSPFNSAASRETSFAKVEILPIIDKPGEVELDDKELKVDVYRAGGHGGQSVNTTDSAVRVTHLPTGISVAIQNERSQLQNKETALTILRSRLAQLQLEQHAETLADVKGPNQSAEFGNQIRSYVLHPYKQVKDNRTGYETSAVDKVLDGQLDALIDAWLQKANH